MAGLLHLELLGGCRLLDPESGKPLEFRTRKARCLLGLLAMSTAGQLSRDKIASYLWDPAPEEQARASLRQCFREVRTVLGPLCDQILKVDRLSATLDLSLVNVDALDLARMLEKARTDIPTALAAAQLWKGDLFADSLPNAPLFEAWVQVERSRNRSALSVCLSDHLEERIGAGDYSRDALARELIRIEPSHELAHQYLMRFHAMHGDQGGALRQFADLERALAEELDSEPSQESLDLLVGIKSGKIGRGTSKAGQPEKAARNPQAQRSGPPKITIRPPRTRFTDNSKDYLADGFVNLTHSCLSRFRCWVILPWPSSGFDSTEGMDFQLLGRTIGADYVIDALFDWRTQPSRLFVSLIDASDSSQVWSDVLEVSELGLQDLSNSIAGIVASKLASQIHHIALLRYARSAPGDALAYDMWLRGHQLTRQWSTEADAQAMELFEQASEIDPGLACAYASMASVLNTQGMVRPGYENDAADRKRAMQLAQRALSLDPHDSRNHICLGWSWLLAKSAERAETHFRLAVDLNPFDSETLIASAEGMAMLGRLSEAAKLATQAIMLNPLHADYFLGYLAAIRYLVSDYGGAIATVARCPDVFPEIRVWAAVAHAQLGEAEKAREFYSQFIADVSEKWEGPAKPQEKDLIGWLFRAWPILDPAARRHLEAGLLTARRHAGFADEAVLSAASIPNV